MFAAKYKLNNLIQIIDRNRIQIEGTVEEIMPLGNLIGRYKSFNWKTIEIDGHNFREILEAFEKANKEEEYPTVIVANTVFGKDVSFMEGNPDWHAKAPNKEEFEKAMEELK
jgi:transketolase